MTIRRAITAVSLVTALFLAGGLPVNAQLQAFYMSSGQTSRRPGNYGSKFSSSSRNEERDDARDEEGVYANRRSRRQDDSDGLRANRHHWADRRPVPTMGRSYERQVEVSSSSYSCCQ